jgi:hypothetical protein
MSSPILKRLTEPKGTFEKNRSNGWETLAGLAMRLSYSVRIAIAKEQSCD